MSQEVEETTENEFSEVSDSQVRQRVPSPKKQKVLPNLERNVPIMIKNSNFMVRTIWTLVMIFIFMFVLWAGHLFVTVMILFINVAIFMEILSLKRNYEKEIKVPYFGLINWYFFGIGIFFCYGKILSSKLPTLVMNSPTLKFLFTYHNIMSFMFWIGGFLIFTLSLKKGYYRYQFRMFGWAHIILILVVAQSSVMIMNTFEGLVWFILPCSLVIINDIFAYIFGVSFGKTRLIELSPKKTWEGFIGGCISTIIGALILTYYLQRVDYLICPQLDIPMNPFATLTCPTPTVFQLVEYQVPFSWIGLSSVNVSHFQLHSIVLSLFASLVAPFGGFFASGFKRGIKIKDFGDTIPGHGGITDRMDCQILTGMFSYLYLHQIILPTAGGVVTVMGYINQMSDEQKLEIFRQLKQQLGL